MGGFPSLIVLRQDQVTGCRAEDVFTMIYPSPGKDFHVEIKRRQNRAWAENCVVGLNALVVA